MVPDMIPTVSVLIRNRNEGPDLRRVLVRLREQHAQPLEIVVVDNASTDESRQVIAEFQCRLVHLPEHEFTYGRATNLGVENCSGELILMLSSHSLPIGRYFIDDAIAPFSDPRVAAVRIPMAVNTAELKHLSSFAPLDERSSVDDVFRRGPVANGSVFRRQIWVKHRFDEVLGASEDKEWAIRVLREGGYIMPYANATFCYTRAYNMTSKTWVERIQLNETARAQAVNLYPEASLKGLTRAVLGAQREALRKARAELALYVFRIRLRGILRRSRGVGVP